MYVDTEICSMEQQKRGEKLLNMRARGVYMREIGGRKGSGKNGVIIF